MRVCWIASSVLEASEVFETHSGVERPKSLGRQCDRPRIALDIKHPADRMRRTAVADIGKSPDRSSANARIGIGEDRFEPLSCSRTDSARVTHFTDGPCCIATDCRICASQLLQQRIGSRPVLRLFADLLDKAP